MPGIADTRSSMLRPWYARMRTPSPLRREGFPAKITFESKRFWIEVGNAGWGSAGRAPAGVPDLEPEPLRFERDLRGEPLPPERRRRPHPRVPRPEHGRPGVGDSGHELRASTRRDEGDAPHAAPRPDLRRQDANRTRGGGPPDHRRDPGHLRDGPRPCRGRGPVSRGRPREFVDVAGPDAVPEDAEHRADARAPPDRRPRVGPGDRAGVLAAGKFIDVADVPRLRADRGGR